MLRRVFGIVIAAFLVLLGIGFCLGALGVLAEVIPGKGRSAPSFIGAGVLLLFAMLFFATAVRFARPAELSKVVGRNGRLCFRLDLLASDPLCSVIRSVVLKHVSTLALKRRQKLVADDYGVFNRSAWDSEIEYFSQRVVLPHLSAALSRGQFERSVRKLIRNAQKAVPTINAADVLPILISTVVEAETDAHIAAWSLNVPVCAGYATPADFEQWCASELCAVSWDARVTGQSGDQGVDVRATRAGEVMVIQCKLYSQPVGNSAVQEVFAGKAFYKAHTAIVVSTSGFTQAARAIAQQTGVQLIAPEQLREVASRQEKPPASAGGSVGV